MPGSFRFRSTAPSASRLRIQHAPGRRVGDSRQFADGAPWRYPHRGCVQNENRRHHTTPARVQPDVLVQQPKRRLAETAPAPGMRLNQSWSKFPPGASSVRRHVAEARWAAPAAAIADIQRCRCAAGASYRRRRHIAACTHRRVGAAALWHSEEHVKLRAAQQRQLEAMSWLGARPQTLCSEYRQGPCNNARRVLIARSKCAGRLGGPSYTTSVRAASSAVGCDVVAVFPAQGGVIKSCAATPGGARCLQQLRAPISAWLNRYL